MNWVWPISPAQAPQILWRDIAALDDAQRVHQLGLEQVGAAAIIGERRQRAQRREFSDVDAEIGLQAPDRHQHFAGHAIGLFDAPEHRAVLLEHVGAARQPRRNHAAGKFLEALAEDLLRLVPGQHALVEVTPVRPA